MKSVMTLAIYMNVGSSMNLLYLLFLGFYYWGSFDTELHCIVRVAFIHSASISACPFLVLKSFTVKCGF